MVNLLKKIALLSVVLLHGQNANSEEMLWCSGDRAASPICVELNDALLQRSDAEVLSNKVAVVTDPPWKPEDYADAFAVYQEAQAQFENEYYGEAATKYSKSKDLYNALLSTLNLSIAVNKNLVDEVGETRSFQEAISAAKKLTAWGADSLTSTIPQIEAMSRDAVRIGKIAKLLDAGDAQDAESIIGELESNIYAKEVKTYRARMSTLKRDSQFSRLVSEGLKALDKNELETAKISLVKARQLNPSSTTVNEALLSIKQRQRSIRVIALKEVLSENLQAENFLAALDVVKDLESMDPSSSLRAKIAELSSYIEIEKRIDTYANQLTSLSSVNSRKGIQEIIAEIESADVTRFGEHIEAKYQQLKSRYTALAVKVELELISDGVSPVLIKPGGRLGEFKSLVLRVYPGNYRLSVRCVGRQELVTKIKMLAGAPRRLVDLTCGI